MGKFHEFCNRFANVLLPQKFLQTFSSHALKGNTKCKPAKHPAAVRKRKTKNPSNFTAALMKQFTVSAAIPSAHSKKKPTESGEFQQTTTKSTASSYKECTCPSVKHRETSSVGWTKELGSSLAEPVCSMERTALWKQRALEAGSGPKWTGLHHVNTPVESKGAETWKGNSVLATFSTTPNHQESPKEVDYSLVVQQVWHSRRTDLIRRWNSSS